MKKNSGADRQNDTLSRTDKIALWLVCVGTFAFLILFHTILLQSFPNSTDEHLYLYKAALFSQGQLYTHPHPMQPYLSPFYLLTFDDRVFSIFPPGWPLVLAIGSWIGIPGIINPTLSALSVLMVFLLGREVGGKTVGWLSVALFTGSIFFLFNGASFFSHPACLLGVLCGYFFLVRWRSFRRWWFAFLAGLFVGWSCTVRELTALTLFSVPLCWIVWRSEKRWSFLLFLGLGCAPAVLGYFWYNAQLTGQWFLPARFLREGEFLGFGPRTIRVFDYTEIINYQLSDGVAHLVRNVARYALWTVPGMPLLALWGGWKNRHNRTLVDFSIATLFLLMVYMLYSAEGALYYGPRFYYESLGFVSILAAVGIMDVFRWAKQTNFAFFPKPAAFIGSVLWVLLLVSQVGWICSSQYSLIFQKRTLYRMVESRNIHNAVVFVGMADRDQAHVNLIRNQPQPEKADVIYAWDMGPKNKEIMKAFPGRTFYFYGYDREIQVFFLKSLTLQ
jgi:hypothetical protein